MNCLTKSLTLSLLLAGACASYSQGLMNLAFESANVSGNGPSSVSTTNAIPYWTILIPYIANTMPYNDIALDGQSVDLFSTNYAIPAIQGNYSIFVQRGSQFDPDHTGASIMQTGQIPLSAKSIIYWGGALQVTFGAQALAFNVIGSGSGYTIWQADISGYAGQTGRLEFTASWQTSGLLDNIQFSTASVPEPGILSLSAVGSMVFLWHRRKGYRR